MSAARDRAEAIKSGDVVRCTECGESFRPWKYGLVPAHGPYSDRCPGGGHPPASDAP